jgi:hypothetical protein
MQGYVSVDSKDGEMSEWLKEHAWKAKLARNAEGRAETLTHTPSTNWPLGNIGRCDTVNLHTPAGFEVFVSQSYHNPHFYLATVRRIALQLDALLPALVNADKLSGAESQELAPLIPSMWRFCCPMARPSSTFAPMAGLQ